MQIPPWLNPPNFLGAAQSGAQLGAQIRGQNIQSQEAADRMRLSFAEQAFRQQMFQQEQDVAQQKMQQQAIDAMMRRDQFSQELALKSSLEEGRNIRAEDALTAKDQRLQDLLETRTAIAAEGDKTRTALGNRRLDLMGRSETGKNARATERIQAKWDSPTDFQKNLNEYKNAFENGDDFTVQAFENSLFKSNAKKAADVSSKLDEPTKARFHAAMSGAGSRFKDDPMQAEVAKSKILDAYYPKASSQPAQEQPLVKGKRYVQGGVTYEWDGNTGIPVK